AAKPGTQVPRCCRFDSARAIVAGILGSRLSRLTALGRDDSRVTYESPGSRRGARCDRGFGWQSSSAPPPAGLSPELCGADLFSYSWLRLGGGGAFAGLWIGYKMG